MEPDQPVQPAGGFVQARVLGLPLWVWVLIVAIVAYIWFSRKGRASASGRPGGNVAYSSGGGTNTATTNIDKGAVEITVSQGTQKQPHPPVRRRREMITVPDVRGKKYEQAAEQLTDTGLNAQRTSPYVGVVKRQSPHSGTKVQKGTFINLSGKPWPPEKKDNDKG